MKNLANCKTGIGTLKRGDRFRDVSGRLCTFDRWFKDGENAVVATVDNSATDLFAAGALVEPIERETEL